MFSSLKVFKLRTLGSDKGLQPENFQWWQFQFLFVVVIEERYPLIDKIWRWPLLLLFSARFLAICVKNCSTVPKLKTILQFHCRHTIANSLCFNSLACAQTPPPPPPLSKNRFLPRGGGVCTQAINRWSTKKWNSRACGGGMRTHPS